MALVATKDTYALDSLGIRRLVVAGQPIPAGMTLEDSSATKEVDSTELRIGARPVVDADASKPSGTAAEPNAGLSTERAEGLRQAARKGSSKSAAKD